MSLVGLTPSSATSAPQSGAAGASFIMDVNEQDFAQEVIEASMQQPVIVDFWAPWCGPCRTLTPLLEKLVTAQGGAVKLVKVNVDENQALAGQLRIQSIPTVYGFAGGQPVDGFAGAQPEPQLQAFIDKLLAAAGGAAGGLDAAAIDEALAQAQALLKAGQTEQALALAHQVFELAPGEPKAAAVLATLYLAAGQAQEARALLDGLDEALKASPEVKALEGTLALAAQATQAGEPEALRTQLAADPDAHAVALELATALAGRGLKEEAIDTLLASLARDRDWREGEARKKLLELFEAFGPTDPVTLAGRRKLSALLFS